ncbi:hypothetical protein C5167_022255 [Papaver somniferum]|uniref:Uncharacterized protein n=1 Tax=Papaver somniferum TaxID=3469 RepID=A0A4Y7JKG0_PAPSO|nr:hypothetical protein C5167_022255 [Papaver somniferum]
MEGGIAKAEFLASAVPREQLRQQVLKTRNVEDRVLSLEVNAETLKDGLSCNLIYLLDSVTDEWILSKVHHYEVGISSSSSSEFSQIQTGNLNLFFLH